MDRFEEAAQQIGAHYGFAHLSGPVAMIANLARTEFNRGLEVAAGVVEAENERVLATQTDDAAPGSFEDGVNTQTRLTAVLLPDVAAAIRAKKEGGDKPKGVPYSKLWHYPSADESKRND